MIYHFTTGRVKLRCVSRYPKMLLPRPHLAPCLQTPNSPPAHYGMVMVSPWNIKLINFSVSTLSSYRIPQNDKCKYVSLGGILMRICIFCVDKMLTYGDMLSWPTLLMQTAQLAWRSSSQSTHHTRHRLWPSSSSLPSSVSSYHQCPGMGAFDGATCDLIKQSWLWMRCGKMLQQKNLESRLSDTWMAANGECRKN